MTSFDPSFDDTFRADADTLTVSVPTYADCAPTGYVLHWLTSRGWATWLFDGRMVAGQSVRSIGTFSAKRTLRDTQRETTPTMLLRASGLTETEALVLSTLAQSAAVYWLKETDGNVTPYPVYVAPGDYPIWNEAEKLATLEIRVTRDTTRSLRN